MADSYQSIWIINDVKIEIQESNWFTYVPPAPVPTLPTLNYAWHPGGWSGPGGSRNIIDRMDYSNDTVNCLDRADLTNVVGFGTGVANDTHGWSMGGTPNGSVGASINKVDRFTFASDTVNAIANGEFSQIRSEAAGLSNGTYGWMAAGYSNGTTNIIERIDFATSPVTILDRADTTVAKRGPVGLSDGTFGWVCGGGSSNVIERMTYSSDTVNALDRSDLTYGREYFGGVSNSTYGWLGGQAPGPAPNDIDRFEFANDTVNAIGRADSITSLARSPGASSTSYGYFSGGNPLKNNIERLDYSNDTAATLDRGDLTSVTQVMHSVQNSSTAFS